MGQASRNASPRRVVLAVVVTGTLIACGLDVVGSAPDDGLDGGNAGSGTPHASGSSGTSGSSGSSGAGSSGSSGQPPLPDGAAPPVDGGPPGAPEAGTDATVPKDAAPDGAIVFTCPSGNTTDCASCGGGRTLGCVMCAPSGGGIAAICTPPGVSCYDIYRPSGYTWCRCTVGNGARCILPKQGCNPYDNGVCVTCGEDQTDGNPCKGGGSCDQASATCK